MTWMIDKSHRSIEFSAKHMMVSTVKGRFTEWDGVIEINDEHPEQSTMDITIQADSLTTNFEQRDQHLKSPDFLDVAQYPTITFKSKRVELVDGIEKFRVVGDLTIRGLTKEVTMDVTNEGRAKQPWGNMINQGFTAEAKINRKDWGLEWNVALETGGFLVGDQIKIVIDLELVQEAPIPA